MSRTDELREAGASDRTGGGGGGHPFVKWPKDKEYAFVEGRLTKIWTGKYGDTAVIDIAQHSDGLAVKGRDEEGNEITTSPTAGDTVNVGLNSASLKDTLSQDDVGSDVHIAFEGWEESKGGNTYRLFTVLVMGGRKVAQVGGSSDGPDGIEYESDTLPF